MNRIILFLFALVFGMNTYAKDTIYVDTEAYIKVKLDTVFTIKTNNKDVKFEYVDSKIKVERPSVTVTDPVYIVITVTEPKNLVFVTSKKFEITNM